MQTPMVFRLNPRGLHGILLMKCKRQAKTYKCDDLEVGSTLGKYLAEGKAISSQDIRLLEQLLKAASWRSRGCTRRQSRATRCERRVDYIWKFCGCPGCR